MDRKRKIVPPVYLLLALLAMSGLHFYLPLYKYLGPPLSFVGIALIISGIAVAGWAAGAFIKAGTPVIPFEPSTALVISGLYRYTRNPMYLGMVLLLVGAALLFGTLGALIPIPLFVWIIHARFILGEERFLESIFGDDYLRYRQSVRRWI